MSAYLRYQADNEGDLRDAFEKFDWRRTGEISAKELEDALVNLGKPITTREVFLLFLSWKPCSRCLCSFRSS